MRARALHKHASRPIVILGPPKFLVPSELSPISRPLKCSLVKLLLRAILGCWAPRDSANRTFVKNLANIDLRRSLFGTVKRLVLCSRPMPSVSDTTELRLISASAVNTTTSFTPCGVVLEIGTILRSLQFPGTSWFFGTSPWHWHLRHFTSRIQKRQLHPIRWSELLNWAPRQWSFKSSPFRKFQRWETEWK